METRTCKILSVLLLLIATPLFAGLRDIHKDKLPQDKSVLQAYDEAAGMEEYARLWSPQWQYSISKDEVAAKLKQSLDALQAALKSSPDNEELALLTGLVAHYAYNVDDTSAFDVAGNSFAQAHKLMPDDYRPDWFLANHQCQSRLTDKGMEAFLSVESRLPWKQLPADFWNDYIACAILTNMPAHALRAGDYMDQLKTPPSEYRDELMNIARKRLTPSDASATYPAKEVWEVSGDNKRPVFTSFLCGLSFGAMGTWRLSLADVKNGQCVAQFETGPYPSKAGDVIPNILVLVRQAREGESLEEFLKKFMNFPSPKSVNIARCPAEHCLAVESVVPNFYKAAGDGQVIMVAFQRTEPSFPGLVFEKPWALPQGEAGKTSYYRPTTRLTRLRGTLYYLVTMDTASSVKDNAKSDFDNLLLDLKAE